MEILYSIIRLSLMMGKLISGQATVCVPLQGIGFMLRKGKRKGKREENVSVPAQLLQVVVSGIQGQV